MMTITDPMKGITNIDYYLDMARQAYYTENAYEAGEWFGPVTDLLGLKGKVKPAEFRNLLMGFSPDGRFPFVQNAGHKDRQTGWDITLSVPKAVSVLYALSPPEIQKEIEAAIRQAAQKTLSCLAESVGLTRRGKGGAIIEHAAVLFAIFFDIVSRANDPQLHFHCVLINLSLRQDGTTGSIRSKDFFQAKMTLGAIFQAAVASELRERLHLVIEPEKVGFHIRGVPKELCRAFSQRRQAIEKSMHDEGKEGAIAAKDAALKTRQSKDNKSSQELFQTWKRIGEQHGCGERQVTDLLQRGETKAPVTQKAFQKSFEELLQKIPPHKLKQRAAVEIARKLAIERRADGEALYQTLRQTKRLPFIRVEWKPMVRKAPSWSPMKTKTPRVVIGPERKGRWGYIQSKKGLYFGEARVQERRPFPNAPKWSPVHDLKFLALRVKRKAPLTDWMKKFISQRVDGFHKNHGSDHSMSKVRERNQFEPDGLSVRILSDDERDAAALSREAENKRRDALREMQKSRAGAKQGVSSVPNASHSTGHSH